MAQTSYEAAAAAAVSARNRADQAGDRVHAASMDEAAINAACKNYAAARAAADTAFLNAVDAAKTAIDAASAEVDMARAAAEEAYVIAAKSENAATRAAAVAAEAAAEAAEKRAAHVARLASDAAAAEASRARESAERVWLMVAEDTEYGDSLLEASQALYDAREKDAQAAEARAAATAEVQKAAVKVLAASEERRRLRFGGCEQPTQAADAKQS